MWILHMTSSDGTNELKTFSSLVDLASSIDPGDAPKFRLPPSEYGKLIIFLIFQIFQIYSKFYLFLHKDKSQYLLLCRPPQQLIAKQTLSESNVIALRRKPPQILDMEKHFRFYLSK